MLTVHGHGRGEEIEHKFTTEQKQSTGYIKNIQMS